MHRRSFLTTIGALPFTPGTVTRVTPPALPRDEDCVLWWRYVQHAIKIGDPAFCTDQFLDMVLMRSHLNDTTDREARRVVRAAFRGAYSESDVPVRSPPDPPKLLLNQSGETGDPDRDHTESEQQNHDSE